MVSALSVRVSSATTGLHLFCFLRPIPLQGIQGLYLQVQLVARQYFLLLPVRPFRIATATMTLTKFFPKQNLLYLLLNIKVIYIRICGNYPAACNPFLCDPVVYITDQHHPGPQRQLMVLLFLQTLLSP